MNDLGLPLSRAEALDEISAKFIKDFKFSLYNALEQAYNEGYSRAKAECLIAKLAKEVEE